MPNTMPEVKIYSTPSCHFCHMAKEFLTAHNVPFTDYDVAADLDKRKEMVEMTGQMGVPVIVIGDKTMVGYSQAEVSGLLGIK